MPQLIGLPTLAAFIAIMSAIGSAIGVYVGMRVGLAKLETWQGIADQNIAQLRKDVNVLQDDSLVYDLEIDGIMERQGVHRARRQEARR